MSTTNKSGDVNGKSKGLKTIFKRRTAGSSSISTEQAHDSSSSASASDIYWPEVYLLPDLPQAQVWTYGYDADVIGGFFQANNQNTISQHGRDLSVKLDRDIENTVRWPCLLHKSRVFDIRQKPIAFVVHSLGGIIVKDVRLLKHDVEISTYMLL